MSQEKEASLPIESFLGINRSSSKEDLIPGQLFSAQNLWEREVGILETRGHSVALTSQLPSNITGLDRNFRIYRNESDKVRICAAHCTRDVEQLADLPNGVALSFVSDANGWWNNDVTFGAGYGATTFNFTHRAIILRFIGYGLDKFYEINVASVTGYSAATDQKLRVVVSQAQEENITGIEIYAVCKSGEVETPATITSTSQYNETTMWCGFIELVSQSTGTFDFLYSPYSYDDTIADGTDVAATERTFNVTAYRSGAFGETGTLKAGKTYYVLVMQQHASFNENPNGSMEYLGATIDVDGGELVPITIPGDEGDTGYIVVNTINANTVCFMVCIGESAQTMQPIGIFNDSETIDEGITVGDVMITDYPRYSPAVMNIEQNSATSTFCFRTSDFSTSDMLIGIEDDGSIFPIFATRLHMNPNAMFLVSTWLDWFGNIGVSPNNFGYMWGIVNAPDAYHKLSTGGKFEFVQYKDLCYFVNDWSPLRQGEDVSSPIGVLESRTNHNYFVCDGNVAANVIEDYRSVGVMTLPSHKHISIFRESIVLGGGIQAIDPENGLPIDPRKQITYSRAGNPHDFTVAGAASPMLQQVLFAQTPEKINGLGIYSNTTSDSGPLTFLIISKLNSIWILNELPFFDGTAVTVVAALNTLLQTDIRRLSGKVGCASSHTIVNTPVGTIFSSYDQVYLLRESGEPAPIGQEISNLLKASNLTNASACYHDRHYKLSFRNEDLDGDVENCNNVEVWLNIHKMIENKGGSDWVGPMVGRRILSSFVEDLEGDGDTYATGRDRICVDNDPTLDTGVATHLRIYKADVTPAQSDTQILDFATAVESEIVTKDFDITPQDNNWNKLIKRWYWKLRINKVSATPLTYTDSTYIDGVFAEDQPVTAYGVTSVDFDEQPLKLSRVFPESRIRGRTVRKVLTTTDRIGIGGFQLNYSVERRRI